MTKAQKKKAEKMEIIKDMWSKGHSLEEIGEATGYAPGTIGVYLSDAHLRTPDRAENHLEDIVAMWNEGKTFREISEKIGFSQSCVCKIAKTYGLGRKMIDRGYEVERDLIDENTVFANVNEPRIFRCVINGKRYIDVTEAFM